MRQYGSIGKIYPEKTIWDVWGKGQVVGANDPVCWRMDIFGAWIFRSHYGSKVSEYGWKIGHIKPLDKGRTNDIYNLIPLHCGNAMRKTDGSLDCCVIAESYHNINIKNKELSI